MGVRQWGAGRSRITCGLTAIRRRNDSWSGGSGRRGVSFGFIVVARRNLRPPMGAVRPATDFVTPVRFRIAKKVVSQFAGQRHKTALNFIIDSM